MAAVPVALGLQAAAQPVETAARVLKSPLEDRCLQLAQVAAAAVKHQVATVVRAVAALVAVARQMMGRSAWASALAAVAQAGRCTQTACIRAALVLRALLSWRFLLALAWLP